MKQSNMWFGALVLLSVAACSSTGGSGVSGEGVAIEDRSGTGLGNEVETLGAEAYGNLDMQALNDPASPLSQKIIYFELDSIQVAEADRATLSAHAAFLAGHPDMTVTLEGHADERGSREYNIGLGDRRAQAVRRQLELQGVAPHQITTVSYGEERPAMEGQDEYAWRMNRRVELVYGGQ